MILLRSTHIFITLIVGAVSFRSNSHVVDNDGMDNLGNASQPANAFMLEDITDSIAVLDAAGAARCCCDENQRGRHFHTRRSNDRTGVCIFFLLTGSSPQHCSGLGRHARRWQTGVLHHYTNTESQRCTIDRAEVPEVAREVQQRRPDADYCKEVLPIASMGRASHQPLVAVEAKPLGDSATVSCEAGYEPKEAQVSCVVDTVAEGAFSPAPECRRLGDWCAAIENDAGVKVVGAGAGQSRTVACADGMEAEEELVTCGQDGLFHPQPACQTTARFDVTIRAAEVEARYNVRCCCDTDHQHFTSISRWLTGASDHTGVCLFVFDVDHCREIEGRNHWVHYRRSGDGRCVVQEQEYRRLNDAYPPESGWNRETERINH